MTEIMDGQVSLFGQDTWSGKTSPELSAAEAQKGQTSLPSLRKSSKSANRAPVCVCVSRTGDGLTPGAITLKMEAGALLGAYTTHSFGESPREENVSRLSQILEDCPPQRFSLSEKAVIGILRRANRRGKQLPIELRLALQNQSRLMEDSCGETESRNAGEILRTLWEEVGETAFVEWAKRAYVLVSETTLLLCGLREQGTWRKTEDVTCLYAKAEQGKSEDCNARCPVRYLWESGVYGSSPSGRKPDEQFARKLGAFVQELSRQTAQEAIFVRCLWEASEGTSAMRQALASMATEQQARVGHGIHLYDSGESGGSERTDPFVTTQSASKGTASTEPPRQAATDVDGAGGVLHPQHHRQTGSIQQSAFRKEPVNQGGAKEYCSSMNTQEPCQPSTTSPSLTAYGISSYDSNAMKSPNPHAGIYEADTSRTLDLNGGSPACNQGGVAIVAGFDPGQGAKAATVGYELDRGGPSKQEKSKPSSFAVDCRNGIENADVNGTLQAKANGGISLNCNNVIRTSES